jgi:small subunit ribosomal protein S9
MTENTTEVEETYETNAEGVAYSSESAPVADEVRPATIAPASATGRRKEAVARVRLVPGTGEWSVNGRPLDSYFPNKLHQQVVNEPFTALQLEGRFDVIARIHGGGITGQAGALRLGVVLDRDFSSDDFDFETLGGLVYHCAGDIPEEGDEVTYEDLRMRVVRVDNHRIVEVLIVVDSEEVMQDPSLE